MQRRRGRTTIRWVSAFVNLTLDICIPARVIDIMARDGDGSARFDRPAVAPDVRLFYVAGGDPDTLTIVLGPWHSEPARGKLRHGRVLFDVIPSKHSSENWDGGIPAR
jgi:hypothetical protein